MVFLEQSDQAKTNLADAVYSVVTLSWVALVFTLRVMQGVTVDLVLIRIPKHLVMGMHLFVGVGIAIYSQVKLNTLFLLSSIGLCLHESTLTFATTETTQTANGIRGTWRAMKWCSAVESAIAEKRFCGWDMSLWDNISGGMSWSYKWLTCKLWGQITSKPHDLGVLTSVHVDKKFPGGAALVVVVHENEGVFGWLGSILHREWEYTPKKFKGEDDDEARLVDVKMYKSAQGVCKGVASYVEENDPKRIVVTGYSMGGGVAVYVTGLLQKRFPKKLVSGYAFGPPCVLTKLDIATTPIENLECYMFSQDIVPRLSQNWVMHTFILCYEFGRRLVGSASMQYKWNDWQDMAVPNPTTIFADDYAVPLPSPPFNPFRESLLECGANHSLDKYAQVIQNIAGLDCVSA